MVITVLAFTARACGNGERCCRGMGMGNHGDHCPSVDSEGVWQWEEVLQGYGAMRDQSDHAFTTRGCGNGKMRNIIGAHA